MQSVQYLLCDKCNSLFLNLKDTYECNICKSFCNKVFHFSINDNNSEIINKARIYLSNLTFNELLILKETTIFSYEIVPFKMTDYLIQEYKIFKNKEVI